MPYTPTSPTPALCDDLVTHIEGQWTNRNAADEVKRFHKGLDIDTTVSGRKVFVIPLGYDSIAAARGQDFYTHRIAVLTVERYEPAADPELSIPIEWIDRRVDFVNTLRDWLDFMRDGTQPTFNRNLLTLTAPVEEIYDEDMLRMKVFWCWVEFGIQEQVSI